MSRKNDCTPAALEGYNATNIDCPYLATSSSAEAWHIGAWLQATGRTSPRDVAPSRGDTFHVNGMRVTIRWRKGAPPEIERIA
jgi:hypothetical protein